MLEPTAKKAAITLIIIGICTIVLLLMLNQKHPNQPGTALPNHSALDVDTAPMQPIVPLNTPPVKLSKHVAEYHIQVSLDEVDKKLYGKQTVTWTHPGQKPVKEVVLHMYPNAFQSMNTTFNLESGGKLRSDRMKATEIGFINIISIRTSTGENLTNKLKFIQPDDGNKHDQTLAEIRLSEPVQPGEQLTLHFEFEVKLPYVYARMGYAGDFIMAGQWFPKLAAYEPKHRRGRSIEGWNVHQYHGNSEFYADFSIYSVQVKVPSRYVVAATGFPTGPAKIHNDTKTYTFYAEDVHDFAWAASPDFIYVEEPFSTAHIPGVKIKLYLDPAHEALKDRYIQVVKRSLASYARWFGSYPYSTLSVVVPPAGANGAGGMEYPTLITAWAADHTQPGFELERVITHEIAHQYWYGIVANNEFQEAWLDEAFTSYAEDKFMEQEYGIKAPRLLQASYITSPAPLKQDAWEYHSSSQYAENVYLRGKLVLLDIESQIGEAAMRKVLRTYFQQWKFKHPSTQDFLSVLERVTKQSWGEYFERFVFGGNMVDFTVETARSEPIILEDGQPGYRNQVIVVANHGQHASVPIHFGFADQTIAEEQWDGAHEKTEFTITSRSPLQWVMIDPEYSVVLENRHINNYYNLHINQKHKVQFNFSISKAIEVLLSWIAI